MTTHLIIPDSHVKHGDNLRRFDWLGKLIVDVRPDVIINLGDMADMESLCSYDKGTKSFEGRRYLQDIECVIEANQRLFTPLIKFTKRQRKNKKKLYTPKKVFCLGNHEERINKAVEIEAILENVISIDDLEYNLYYDEVSPYLETVCIDGVHYTHAVQNDLSSTVISADHLASNILSKKHCSVVVGHNHKFDYKMVTRIDGKKIFAMSAGCFFEGDLAYARTSNKVYWRGVVLLKNVVNGFGDIELISIDRLRRLYG